MVTGDNGVSGALVQRVANKESNQENVNVIHQLHSTVEISVMERQKKHKFATRMSHVQVSLTGNIFNSSLQSSNLFHYSKFNILRHTCNLHLYFLASQIYSVTFISSQQEY